MSGLFFAQIAQSVEQGTENPRVDGSIPSLGTIKDCDCRSPFYFFTLLFRYRYSLLTTAFRQRSFCIIPNVRPYIKNDGFEGKST